jgi:ribonuclease J
VLHTADWKIDASPVVGPAFDHGLFEGAGATSLDAVVCDSTNATVPGHSVSESVVRDALRRVIRECSGRVVVACFASNVARLASLASVAESCGRYLGLLGRSLHTIHSAAVSTRLLERSGRMIAAEHLGYLPREEGLAVATGSQGEPGAALARLAAGAHPSLELEAGDTLILSSRVIPGNEEAVRRLVERFRAMGVHTIEATDGEEPVHASGHPCADELAAMYRWLRPRLAVPVHGEERHMLANAGIARAHGARLALTGSNGDLFYLAPEPGLRRRAARVGRLQVDDDGALVAVSATPA